MMTTGNDYNDRSPQNFVRIHDERQDDEFHVQQHTVPERIRNHARRWARRFFPWTTEFEQREADFSKRQTFPWL